MKQFILSNTELHNKFGVKKFFFNIYVFFLQFLWHTAEIVYCDASFIVAVCPLMLSRKYLLNSLLPTISVAYNTLSIPW